MEQCYEVADFWTTTLLKVTLLHGRFSYFLNYTNDIKSRKGSQIIFHYHLEKNKSYENRSYQPSEAATRCVL